MFDFCVVNTYEMHIYSFTTPEKAEEVIAKAKKKYQEDAKKFEELGQNNKYFAQTAKKCRKATFEAMTFDEFLIRQKKHLLDKPMHEITEERFYEMLNVLPPLCWTQHKNVEIFCMSEFYTGSFTDQYAHDKNTGKFWCKLVDYTDKSTWIPELLYPDNK